MSENVPTTPKNQKMPKRVAFQYASIITALVLVGQFPNIESSLNTVAMHTMSNLASVVGMVASVPPNQDNTLAQALENKEAELNQRERDIDAKEREIRAVVIEETAKQNRITIFVIVGIATLLTILIGVNFYLDRRRGATMGGADVVHKSGPHAHEGEFTTKL